jgi:hypothetical protein
MNAQTNAEAVARKLAAQCRSRFEQVGDKCMLAKHGAEYAALGGCDGDGQWRLALPYQSVEDRRDVDGFVYLLGGDQ